MAARVAERQTQPTQNRPTQVMGVRVPPLAPRIARVAFVESVLLLFEADVAGIIHMMDPPGLYPCAPPQMRRVIAAFGAMPAGRGRFDRIDR